MVQSTALFERSEQARRAVDALEEQNFETIKIDEYSTHITGTDRLDADDLVELGIASREAARCADAIHDGATLVLVSCDENRIDELRHLFSRFDLHAPTSPTDSKLFRFRRGRVDEADPRDPIDEGGIHRDERIDEDFRRADSERMIGEHDTGDASGLSRRAHGNFSTDQPEGQNRESSADSETPPTADSPSGGMPDRFEASFRRHYQNYYADSDRSYGEYARAYHYGVVLAEHGGFRDRSFDEIQEFARQGWDSQTHGPWPHVREAVRYGWETVRGRNLFEDPGRHL